MNRAQRRERYAKAVRNTPPHLRDVPVLEITPENMQKFYPEAMDGDVITIAGLGHNQRGGIVRVKSGEEKPIRLKVRHHGMVKG